MKIHPVVWLVLFALVIIGARILMGETAAAAMLAGWGFHLWTENRALRKALKLL